MSVNLLSAESAALGEDFARQASAFLGESESKVTMALKALVPAVLGGFLQKGATQSGAEGLLTDLKESEVDAELSNNPTRIFSGAGPGAMLESGHRMLSRLFGDGLDRLTDGLANVSGMSRQAAGRLMDMSSPVMFSVLKKQANEEHLDGPGLMGMLSGQGGYIHDALDTRLLKALGFANAAAFLGGVAGKMAAGASAVGSAAGNAVARTTSPLARVIPWLLIALAFIVGISLMRSCAMNKTNTSDMVTPQGLGQTLGNVAGNASNAAGNAAGAAGNAMSNAAGNVGNAMSNAGNTLSSTASKAAVGVGAAAAGAANAMANATGSMMGKAGATGSSVTAGTAGTLAAGGGQVFFDTSSARIGADGMKAVQAAADSIKAQGGMLTVTGYTDKRGSMAMNEALAKRRAQAVLTALAGAGVGADKISMKPADTVEANAESGSSLSDDQARRVDIMYQKP